jgi:Pectate lyase superfamily protein
MTTLSTQVDGWYDVTDIAYGADPTGGTDSTPAILKAMAAMPITQPGTLYFPPGNYRCDNDIHLTRMCVMQGAGAATGDVPATTIEFAAGKGVIVEAQTTSADGFGGHSIIRQINFIGKTLELKDRENNKDYVVGDRIRTPAHNDNRYYFECIKAGKSSNAELNTLNLDPRSKRNFTFAYLPYTGTLRPSNGST